METITEVLIIGAGPAGLAATIQLRRYGVPVRLLECGEPGGLLRNANLVENYPGFPQGIRGRELVELILKQAYETGVKITAAQVTRLDWNGRHFRAQTDRGILRSRCAVVASGTQARQFTDFSLPIRGAERILYEVVPLQDVEDAEIAIVGAGDAAFDYALNLAARRNRVSILNRGESLKCLPLLWKRSKGQEHIRYFHQTLVNKVTPLPGDQLEIETSSPAGTSQFQVDYLIGAIGRRPRLDFISENLRQQIDSLADQGWLHLIGDVRNGIFRQTTIAVGDGVRAAMQIYQKLKRFSQ